MNQPPRRHFLKTGASLTAVAASAGLLAACGGGSDVVTPPAPTKNIVELAQATASLSILVEAVIEAGLVGALSAPGALTVFAPSNDAFGKLLTDDLKISKAQLFANKPLLTKVLQYHVLGAKVLKADIPLGKAIDPIVPGTSDVFKIDVVGTDVIINDGRNRKSKITTTDILATNGVVHLIDKVILPADKDIVATAQSVADFSTLVDAVITAGLVTTLQGAGPLTVFAPTNAAFTAALTELGISKDALFANVPLLTKILTYHVVPSRVLKANITPGAAVTTAQGETFTINAAFGITDQRPTRGPANITATDTLTSNGVIHVIDKVILPKA